MLDMDSSVSPTYGDQEGTAYNGHFACTCYHPVFVFNQFVTSVEGHDRLNHLLPTVRRMNVAGTKRGAFQIATQAI